VADNAPYMHGYPGRSAQIVGVSLAHSLMRVAGEMPSSESFFKVLAITFTSSGTVMRTASW
jgi:hypothetical protein